MIILTTNNDSLLMNDILPDRPSVIGPQAQFGAIIA